MRVASSVLGDAAVLAFVFAGPLELYDSWISSLGLPFILSGVLFLLGLVYAGFALSLPSSIWRVFHIEKRYGFGRMTPGLFLRDSAKALLLTTVLSSALVGVGLYIVEKSPGLWWLWTWALFLVFGVFFIYISPLLIEPIFNRFEPIRDVALTAGIREVAGKAGIRVEKVLKMDASRRTAHTNAYFTGLGGVKRIVLFDTLIERLGPDEIKSVIAHEAGHWKRRHIVKRLALIETLGLFLLYASHLALKDGLPGSAFGLEGGSFFSGAALLVFLWGIAAWPLRPLLLYLSRKDEFDADRYASSLTGEPGAMAGAIRKLSLDNLSNLFPHPLYTALHYSHPPAAERIRRLQGGD